MENSTLFLSVLSSVLLVAALVVFLRVSYGHRQQREALQNQLHNYAQCLTEKFLQRELLLTEQMQRSGHQANLDTNSDPMFARLRVLWLKAELAALREGGRRHSDYKTLQKRVRSLLQLTRQNDRQTASLWDNGSALSQLQKVRATITAQNESVAEHRQQANTEEPSFTETLDKVGNNNADLLLIITGLEQELFSVQDKFNEASRRLVELQLENAAAAATTQNRRTISASTFSELRQSYRQTLNEMQRMRDINRNQRLLILRLEEELSNLRVDSRQYSASVKLLEKLKLQLRDYETCTAILEMETDTLRKRLLQLGGTRQNWNSQDKSDLASMETEGHDHDEALYLLAQIISAETPERVGKLLIEWLRSSDTAAVLFINDLVAPIWISSETAIDSHSKQLLQGIVPVPSRPLVEINEGIILAYPAVRLLLYTDSQPRQQTGNLSRRLQIIMAIISNWLQMLTRDRQDIESVRQQISNLLPQYDYMKAEQAGICTKFKQEFTNFLNSANLSSVQRQVVTGMFEDFAAELDILNQVSTLIRRNIAGIAQDTEPLP